MGTSSASREAGKSQLGRMSTSLDSKVGGWSCSPFLQSGQIIPAQTFSVQEQNAFQSRPEEKKPHPQAVIGPLARAWEEPFHAAAYIHFSGKCIACLSQDGELQSTNVHPQQFPRCAFSLFYCNSRKVNAFRNQGGFLQMFKLHFYFLSSALQRLLFFGQELVGGREEMEKDHPESFA